MHDIFTKSENWYNSLQVFWNSAVWIVAQRSNVASEGIFLFGLSIITKPENKWTLVTYDTFYVDNLRSELFNIHHKYDYDTCKFDV